jgi:ComEC/Rec2-related protein
MVSSVLSFIKSELYRQLLRQLATPSFFLFIWCAGTALAAYGLALAGLKEAVAGFILSVLALISAFIFTRRLWLFSGKRNVNEGYFPQLNSTDELSENLSLPHHSGARIGYASILLMLITAVAISISIFFNAFNSLPESAGLSDVPVYAGYNSDPDRAVIHDCKHGNDSISRDKSTIDAIVRSSTEGIMERQLILGFACNEEGHKKTCRGIMTVPAAIRALQGDRIIFKANSGRIVFADAKRSVFLRNLYLSGVGHRFFGSEAMRIYPGKKTLMQRVRLALEMDCDRIFSRATAKMIKALYFGNQKIIDNVTLFSFKCAGVLHVVSASGLHVGIVAAMPIFLLGLIRLPKRVIYISASVLLAGYLSLTDMPVSLVRACLMFFMFSAFFIMDFERNVFNLLCLSGIMILAFEPRYIFDLGFHLSFSATAGIVLLYRFYKPAFAGLPGFVSSALAVGAAAQALAAPVIFSAMSEINITGYMANLIIVPMSSLMLVAAIATNALYFFVPTAKAGIAVDAIYDALLAIVKFLAELDGHWVLDGMSPVVVMIFMVMLLPVLPLGRFRRFYPPMFASAVFMAWLMISDQKPGSFLIKTGRSQVVLEQNREGSLLYGNIYKRDAALVAGSVKKMLRSSSISMRIDIPDRQNLMGFAGLARLLPVSECEIDKSYAIGRPFEILVGTVEAYGGRILMSGSEKSNAALSMRRYDGIMGILSRIKAVKELP